MDSIHSNANSDKPSENIHTSVVNLARVGRGRYPVLRVNSSAMDLLHEGLGLPDEGIPGVTFTAPQAEAILRHINIELRRCRMRNHKEAVQAWEQIRGAVEQNRADAAGGPMVAVLDPSAIEEELDHVLQIQATGDVLGNHLGPEGTRVLLSSPDGSLALQELRRTYPDIGEFQAVMEIGVRLMRPWRYRELGLTPDGAQVLREAYVDMLIRRHGFERVAKIIDRVQSAQSSERKRAA